MSAPEKHEALFLETLRSAIHGESAPLPEILSREEWQQLYTYSWQHRVIGLVAQALYPGQALADLPGEWPRFRALARRRTAAQAARTAEFLLLLGELEKMGLRPAVLKGIVCRSLYPDPEQRLSNDEDLLIAPEELPAYHEAMLNCGLRQPEGESYSPEADELTYVDPERDLYLELHVRPFSPRAGAYAECNAVFEGALERCETLTVYGREIRTLGPTDHLLFMICHAYKHILYSGVGIRQICDICLFAKKYDGQIAWTRVRGGCDRLGISALAAAMFRIGEKYLAIPGPAVFADLNVDELPLLHDCVSGGLYGCEDPDRQHSSNLTLDAVEASKRGRGKRGTLRSLFPEPAYMRRKYRYLARRPWLLPVAWAQRIYGYLFREKANPARSLQIGRERIEMLKQYNLM